MPDDETPMSWPIEVANTLKKMSSQLVGELFGDTIITCFTEWCETPMVRGAGCCNEDTCVVYGQRSAATLPQRHSRSDSDAAMTLLSHVLRLPWKISSSTFQSLCWTLCRTRRPTAWRVSMNSSSGVTRRSSTFTKLR